MTGTVHPFVNAIADDGDATHTRPSDWNAVHVGSPYPLDRYVIDGTYGDDFTGASLSGLWTRRNYTGGAETYQLGPDASYIRINGNGRAVGDAYFATAAGSDWTIAMKSIMPINQTAFGLCVVDTNGTGVACLPIYTAPSAPLLVQVTTYTSYGGNYVQPGIAGSNPNVNFYGAFPYSLGPFWQYLRKSGTNYYSAVSWDGDLWCRESSALAWAGTVDRWGFIHAPLSATPTTNTENTIDWFNKIA